ncbi:MAG: hypothetical protein K2O47_04835 [Muribaculaceae bacterium]|nr:hypothetical protein [Muribaculaceae bacterium]
MIKRPMDINDDEIRVISPAGDSHPENKSVKKNKRALLMICIAVIVLAVLLAVALYFTLRKTNLVKEEVWDGPSVSVANVAVPPYADKAFVEVFDTVINGTGLTFLTPHNAAPVLAIGEEALSDTTSLLVAQAADIRADNGKIAGSFVLKGDLISKGEAKAGFCAIVDGRITIGVADATPMLEQAIESNGYFFRQYPLVVGGQIIENKPKGISFRKALVEKDGFIGIAMSKERLTFHDFSQVLVDAGVRNAIYLVGSTSPGYYKDAEGRVVRFGKEEESIGEYVSFIVWK